MTATNARPWRFDLPAAVTLLVVTLALFWPVRHDDFTNFDDPEYVSHNPKVLGGLTASDVSWAFSTDTFTYWHPLTWLTLQADVSLWGARPGQMALENVVLHAVGATFWYLVWARATGRRWRALVVALLFAVHPTRVESVAWICERKDVLAGALATASVLSYVNFVKRGRRYRWYAAALVAAILAVMAKPMAVTLPFQLLLLDFWPLGRLAGQAVQVTPASQKQKPRTEKMSPPAAATWYRFTQILIEKAPFALVAALGVVMTLLAKGQADAVPTLQQLGIWQRLATATVGYCRYLGKLIAPIRLSIFYPYQHNLPVRLVLAGALFLAAVTWLSWRERRRRPHLLFGWCWFVVSLLPVIGLVQSGSQSLADRFVYTAAIGPFVAVVWSIGDGVASLPERRRRIAGAGVVFLTAVILSVYTALTFQYLPAWRNSVAVWSWAARSVDPPDSEIEAHLGEAWLEADQPARAIEPYMAALDEDPENVHVQVGVGDVMLRLRPDEGVKFLAKASEAAPDNPLLHFKYGFALAATGHRGEAAAEFRQTLKLDPGFAAAQQSLDRLREKG